MSDSECRAQKERMLRSTRAVLRRESADPDARRGVLPYRRGDLDIRMKYTFVMPDRYRVTLYNYRLSTPLSLSGAARSGDGRVTLPVERF